ncbi:hypothetical protein MSAS_10950 [Mycobacterium saskatchewanense]|uniref:Transmembrane protein n=1 Tax=Mycobacterium saskatchewanense TaxID=220927 RepID=A0AAJ3NVB4_9MYCO|nr:phage holin family protein [Mycobacterium saskatchewanense]ORW74445.1 hypothetical protein AWC23_05120 [Mycobacterium saskatchewanense]BBX61921.1 hypothetical protein MSAS_10950 [Mycobacterium saskatchewanense]
MLIIALVLALIGLVALVFAVVTSNELVAWVCIGASVLGVVLLIIDAVRERQRRDTGEPPHEDEVAGEDHDAYVDYPEEVPGEESHDLPTGDATGEDAAHATGEPEVSEESRVPADGPGEEPAR